MLRLIINDFRLNAVFVFWVFLLFNVQLVLMARLGILGKYVVGGTQLGFAFASAMVVAVFLREEQNKGQVINRSLPISHAKVVCARYLSVCLLVIGNVLYGLFYQGLVGLSRPVIYVHVDLFGMFGDSYPIGHSLIVRALAVATTIAIAVPLVVRYGTFWRILIGYVVLTAGWSRAVEYLLRWSLSARLLFGSLGWFLLGVLLIIAILATSIQLSTWLYGKREL